MNYLLPMQPLDPRTLFSIFEQGDEEIYKEHGIEENLKNPYVLMGMVLRGLENYTIMDMMYTRHYGDQYKNVKPTIKLKYFNKLFSYLTRIDHTDFNSIYTIGESFEKQEVYIGLEKLKKYFEVIEHYEKCAVIKNFQDFLQETQVKTTV